MEDPKEKDQFEERLLEFLSSEGYLFPTSPDEVEAFESRTSKDNPKVPENLFDSDAILTKGYAPYNPKDQAGETIVFPKYEEGMAMAARNQTEELSDEAKKLMEEDRKNAEEQNEQNPNQNT